MTNDNEPNNDNTTDTTAPTDAAPTNEPAPTEEPKLQFTQRQLDDHVNKILTSRLPRIVKKQIAEALASARGEPKPAADPDQERARAAFQAIEDERKAQLSAAEERERQLLERELRSETEHVLSSLGCINVRAARLVLAEDGRISRNADGMLIFDDGSDEGVDLSTGLKAWLHTDEGKNYLAPRGGGDGSGFVPRGASRTGSASSVSESRAAANQLIARWVLGGGK